MIRVNLIPPEERERGGHPAVRLPQGGFWLTMVLVVAVLVPLFGLGLMQRVKIAGLKSDIQEAENESRLLRPQIEKIRALQKEQQELSQRLRSVQSLSRDRYLPVEVMDELASQTPEDLWFTELSQKATGEFAVEGMTFSNLLVAELMTRMEETDIFHDVELTVSERPKEGDGKVVHFALAAKIKP